MVSYAVLWSEAADGVQAGKLELEPRALCFQGGRQLHRVFYEDIEAVHVGRADGERLGGRPSLVLDLAVGGPLRIGSLDRPGALNELAERLGHLTATGIAL